MAGRLVFCLPLTMMRFVSCQAPPTTAHATKVRAAKQMDDAKFRADAALSYHSAAESERGYLFKNLGARALQMATCH